MRMAGIFAHLSVRRRILCGILSLLIFANMALIFSFSVESPSDSGQRSEGVTRAVVSILVKDFEKMEKSEQDALVEAYHPVVRKLAHFSEFALLGFLCGALAFAWGKGKYLWWWLAPAIFCLVYAISDEVHQMFTGRGPAVTDVLIDFAGSLMGIALIHAAVAIIGRIRARKEKRLCKSQDIG